MSNQSGGQNSHFEFSHDQRVAWLRLYRSQNVGPKTFRDLISHFGTAQAALDNLPEIAKRGGAASQIRVSSSADAEREIAQAGQVGARYITMGERGFPPLLRRLDQAPPILCCLGNAEILEKRALAIVGSRNASISGLRITERIASEVGEKGYVVASGLARGIDTAAHKASLKTGTIAVLAGGIDKVYPAENIVLAEEIVKSNGALISEMPIGYSTVATDFPRRNRIVSGLSQAVLVVEAAKRSGSLITARFANESGRQVLAVPGSPLDPRSAGTNSLIRNGATLVTSTDDVLEALRPLDPEQNGFVYDISEDSEEDAQQYAYNDDAVPEVSHKLRERILASVGVAPVEVDDIIRFCEAEPAEVQLVLLELALAGRLEHHAGNRISLV